MTQTELVIFATRLIDADPDGWRRLRIAVTPEEFEALRNQIAVEGGTFVHAIMGIPLQVDECPERPIHNAEVFFKG